MALSAPQSGDMLPPADVAGKVMIVIPTEFVASIDTVQGPSPAIRVDVAVLSDHEGENGVPTYSGALWFNVKLYNNLKRQIGASVLGVMAQGAAQPGKNAPWQLDSMMSDPNWLAFAEAWLETPVGQAFEAGAAAQINEYASNPTGTAAPVAAAPPVQQQAAPAPRPAAPQAPAAPSGGFPSAPVGFTPTNAPAPVAPAAGGDDLLAKLAALPEAERKAAMAMLGL